MIIVPVKEGENIEKALKKFKRKFEKTGAIRELRSRREFEKPSVKARKAKMKAIYVQHLQLQDEQSLQFFYFMADKLLEEPVRRVRPLAVKTRNLSGRAVPKFLQTICTQS